MFNRIFQFLLRLFPADFRETHGSEMEQVYRLQAKESRSMKWRALAAMIQGRPVNIGMH